MDNGFYTNFERKMQGFQLCILFSIICFFLSSLKHVKRLSFINILSMNPAIFFCCAFVHKCLAQSQGYGALFFVKQC